MVAELVPEQVDAPTWRAPALTPIRDVTLGDLALEADNHISVRSFSPSRYEPSFVTRQRLSRPYCVPSVGHHAGVMRPRSPPRSPGAA